MFRRIFRHTVWKRFKIKTCGFRYWKGIYFPIYMLIHYHPITCLFIVPENVKVVISMYVRLYTGSHCYVPFFHDYYWEKGYSITNTNCIGIFDHSSLSTLNAEVIADIIHLRQFRRLVLFLVCRLKAVISVFAALLDRRIDSVGTPSQWNKGVSGWT